MARPETIYDTRTGSSEKSTDNQIRKLINQRKLQMEALTKIRNWVEKNMQSGLADASQEHCESNPLK